MFVYLQWFGDGEDIFVGFDFGIFQHGILKAKSCNLFLKQVELLVLALENDIDALVHFGHKVHEGGFPVVNQ